MRLLVVIFASILGCASPIQVEPQQMQILSKGAPAVRVEINGQAIVQVPCNGGVALKPGVEGVPRLPWDVVVLEEPGGRTVLDERITELPRWLLVQRSSAGVSTSPISGPFVPCD